MPYVILLDDMGTILRIGVRSDVNDRQLQATLVKAADEHQDDAARDYLASMFLQVEAFLVRGGQQSRKFAGRLIRYVPPGNALEREKIRAGRREIDKFTDTLDEARRSFQ